MTLTEIVTVESKNGLHLRPAGILSQIASKSAYKNLGIFFMCKGMRVDVKSVFNIMGLGAFKGSKIVFEVEYNDDSEEENAKKAFEEIIDFFSEGYKNAEVKE